MIRVQQLTKKFGPVKAVDSLNLQVKKGEWYLFVGPNGAGKTTTFRMLAGLVPATSGKIFLDGVHVQRNSHEIKRKIGYLPEKAFLYNYLSGEEYLRFSADMHTIPRRKSSRLIPELLELINFTEESKQLITTYSAGMRKKLGFCSILLHDPPILLLDEPTSDLDPRTSNLFRNLLDGLAKEGKTIFMSTHIFGITEHLCHRVGIIDKGKLIYEGTISELQEKFPGLSFEDIFLELTGRFDDQKLHDYLTKDAD